MLARGMWATWEAHIEAFARSLKVPPIVVLAAHMNRLMSAYVRADHPEIHDALTLADDPTDTAVPSFRDAVDKIRRTVEQSWWFLENGRIQ